MWGSRAFKRELHLAKWSSVSMERRKGGLGVRRLLLLTKAMLCKWCWRYAVKREEFWRQVICEKYGGEEGYEIALSVMEDYQKGLGYF